MSGLYYLSVLLLLKGALCVPLETRDSAETEVEFPDHEKWDKLVGEMRESVLVPLIFNPLQINKLTCGSLITFYDASTADLTVAVDVCLVALVLAKLLVVVPYILNRIDMTPQGGVFSILDAFTNSLEKLGDAGTGPEGEAFGLDELSQEYKNEVLPAVQQLFPQAGFAGSNAGFGDSGSSYGSSAASQGSPSASYGSSEFVASENLSSDTYTGFGFSGWSSGLQKLSKLTGDQGLYDYMPRGFPTDKVEDTVRSVLRQLTKAVHIEKKD